MEALSEETPLQSLQDPGGRNSIFSPDSSQPCTQSSQLCRQPCSSVLACLSAAQAWSICATSTVSLAEAGTFPSQPQAAVFAPTDGNLWETPEYWNGITKPI